MREYLICDRCADLAILMTDGMKPEYYMRRKVFLLFLPSSKWLKNEPYSVPCFLPDMGRAGLRKFCSVHLNFSAGLVPVGAHWSIRCWRANAAVCMNGKSKYVRLYICGTRKHKILLKPCSDTVYSL